MVKHSAQKQRGKTHRTTKRIILIGTEGANKTERLYFQNFNRTQKTFSIQFATGNATNPVGIVADTKKCRDKMDFQCGDRAYAVFDADLWGTQANQIQQAKNDAKKENIEVILSNPCFEVWFVLHFDASTAPYNSSADVITKLKKYIPDYEKSKDIFGDLQCSRQTALFNAGNLRSYHQGNGTTKQSNWNPMTDVDQLVTLL